MSHIPTWGSPTRESAKAVPSVACLAFVVFLAVAFWAGVVWIGNAFMPMLAG